MQLNHLNLSVSNVQGARLLFEKHFGLKAVEGTQDKDTFLALKDENGFVLTLMEKREGTQYPGNFHIGFLKQSKETLQSIYSELKMQGYEVDPPKKYRGENYDLYFNTPFGFTIQVSE